VSGGVIAAVAPGSLAARVGLRPGDMLLTINGHPLRDVIDVQFYGAEEQLTFEARREGQALTIEAGRRYDDLLGLDFADLTFDGIRRCNNRCEFCFVDQMPSPVKQAKAAKQTPSASQSLDLRSSLYVKDDDYRLSFLTGSYITLTNLTEADWARIEEQHLSPLYVSVHATDLDLRRRVLRNPNAPDVMEQLRRLAGLDVEVHAQIVVTPGLNDGPYLDRSIGDLAKLYPAVLSVSVVPVGLTRFHRGGCRVHTEAEMRLVYKQITAWQARLRERLGVNFAYLSDEWHLRLGKPVPEAAAYDGLDLTENGVGLVRRFLEDWRLEIGDYLASISNLQSLTLVTGTLFASVLRAVVGADVVPITNHFFGQTVTVAGLLTGRDVVMQLQGRRLGGMVVLPRAMFGGPEGQSLDGMWPQEIGEALGRRVEVIRE
jgi:putative radical SAM enzyme (TIGR03279 family)